MEGNAGLHRNIFSEESKNGACKYWNSTSEYSRSFTLQKAMIEILVLWWCDIIFTYSKENCHFLILSTALPSTWWWRASSCSAPQKEFLQIDGIARVFLPATSAHKEGTTNVTWPCGIPVHTRGLPMLGRGCILRGHDSLPSMSQQLSSLSVRHMTEEVQLC